MSRMLIFVFPNPERNESNVVVLSKYEFETCLSRCERPLFSKLYELVLGLGQHIQPSYHKLFDERSCESLKIDETYLSFFVYVTVPLAENVLFKPSLTK